jgi:AbrB family looped-hinge helix DNA binding protein
MQLETVLSAKGQIVIPKAIREANHWSIGTRFLFQTTPKGSLELQPLEVSKKLTVEQVAGCLRYTGKAKTIEEMNDAIRIGVKAKMAGKKIWI